MRGACLQEDVLPVWEAQELVSPFLINGTASVVQGERSPQNAAGTAGLRAQDPSQQRACLHCAPIFALTV